MRTISSLLFTAFICSIPSLGGGCSSGALSVGANQDEVRTGDAGGKADATDGGACGAVNPAGCISNGCPTGQRCVVGTECVPSACSCDSRSGSWTCTADCGGGRCIAGSPRDGGSTDAQSPRDSGSADADAASPDAGPATCGGIADPAGCVSTGCPQGKTCTQTSACFSSACVCDVNNFWTCLPDCGGGECL